MRPEIFSARSSECISTDFKNLASLGHIRPCSHASFNRNIFLFVRLSSKTHFLSRGPHLVMATCKPCDGGTPPKSALFPTSNTRYSGLIVPLANVSMGHHVGKNIVSTLDPTSPIRLCPSALLATEALSSQKSLSRLLSLHDIPWWEQSNRN